MHEKDLITALKQGREDAFAVLVEQYKDRIYNTALGFLQQAADAEDLTQDVFLKVFEKIGAFRESAGLGTWLYRITVMSALDRIRRRKRWKQVSAFLFPSAKSGEYTDFHHPGVATEQKEHAAILFRAIHQLPPQQKAAFLLQKLEGLSQQEIAAILETTPGAVESLLHRAKAGLRKILEQDDKIWIR